MRWTLVVFLQIRAVFPIPMRGNELGTACSGVPDWIEFPIPMRGNEKLHRDIRAFIETFVPDPHEG